MSALRESLRDKAGDGSTDYRAEVWQSDLAAVLREADSLLASNDRLHDAMTEARRILQPGDGTINCEQCHPRGHRHAHGHGRDAVIATIQLPLWTLPAAFCVLCFIPDVVDLAWKAWREVGAAVESQTSSLEHLTADSTVRVIDWARDGDWAA